MKFSIITPVLNMERYISETIESVLYQEGDFEIEYIIMDGGSTDKTLMIINKYRERLESNQISIKCKDVTFSCHSEKDKGMYDAINKGFQKSTGDILAWINADDYYLPNAFKTVLDCFNKYPEIHWLKGITRVIDSTGKIISRDESVTYHKNWIQKGIYGREAYYISQDSVFWRRSLWQEAGPINPDLKNAGDYELWIKFANFAPLQVVNFPVSVFRKLENSLTKKNGTRYAKEQEMIRPTRTMIAWKVRIFFNLLYRTQIVFNLRRFWGRLYSIFFMRNGEEYYIEVENDYLTKKRFMTYFASYP